MPPTSLWCGNTEAHNGFDSKTNASSLLLITLAESPRCSETTDGAVLGRVFLLKKKKKAPTALEFSIIIIIGGGSTNTIFFCLYNSFLILPFLILHPLNLPFQFMSARAQLKAFCSGESFFSKPVKTSLTNLTINFCETFLFEWALGFLCLPFGGTRLQERSLQL